VLTKSTFPVQSICGYLHLLPFWDGPGENKAKKIYRIHKEKQNLNLHSTFR